MLVDSKASATTMFVIIPYNINHDLHILADGCMNWQPFLHKEILVFVLYGDAMNCLFKVGLILGFALAGSEDGKYSNPVLENKNTSKYQIAIATLSSNNRCDFGG